MNEKNVLIADDEKPVRELLARTLQRDRSRVFLACNGREAVEIARSNPPIHVAVLDIRMPEMDGIEATRRIKDLDEKTQVIILTEHADIKNINKIVEIYNIIDYIPKPFDINEFKWIVRRAFQKFEILYDNDMPKEGLKARVLALEEAFREQTMALRESQLKYRSIIENSNDMIVVAQEGVLKFVNPKVLRVSGYTMEELSNLPLTEFIHPADRRLGLGMYVNLTKRPELPSFTLRVMKKNGDSLWVEVNGVATLWEGEPAMLNIMRDVSERRRAQESLRIRDLALASSINAIALSNLEGCVTYVNKVFLTLWGYDKNAEVVGKPAVRFWGEKDNASNGLHSVHVNGGWIGKMTAVRKDGVSFEVQATASKVTDETGAHLCTMTSFVDLREHKAAEEVMMRSEKLSSLGQLSAGLAHELRNPLAVISSCAQFCLENMALARPIHENLQVIYRNSQKASKLIADLLLFARPSQLEWKEVGINELINRMVRMATLESPPFHICMELQLQPDLPRIMGDEGKLGQVFLNLIQNAVQALPAKGRVILGTRFLAHPDRVEVKVIDEGCGISQDYLHRIFDPFFTTKDGGTGLGLSICHNLIRQHNGSILVSSSGGTQGTTMTVTLPVSRE